MTVILDTFERSVAAGWGTTATGHTWLTSGGAASDRSVTPGAGRVTLAADPGTIREQRLSRPWGDGEQFAEVVVGQVSVTQPLLVALAFRRDPAVSGAYYRARLVLGTDGTVGLSVTRGTTQIGTTAATGVTYTAGTRLRMRARVDGHRVRARVWQAALAEPIVWQVDQTVATDPIAVGDMGVMISAFTGNTNPAPWVEVRRLEVRYDLVVDNRLAGAVAAQVSNTTLAASATTGTVTIAAPGTRATYDTAQTVLGYPAVRVASGHHRAETPRLRVTLPASGPWSARWYCWVPHLLDAGHGSNEVRSVAVLPTHAWTVHATTAGNVGSRLQVPDLAATSLGWTTEGGSAVATGQWARVEMVYTGTDLITRIYQGHSLTGGRIHTWAGLPDPGRTLDVTAYRWRRRTTLRFGDQGVEVTALQNDLLDLGYNLGTWGADGDFGSATRNAVMSFQTTRGLTPVDGEAGPETRAAMDLALGRIPPPLWVSHLAVGQGQWIGPAEPEVTAAEDTAQLRVGFLPI